jgi:type VI protein secretion system component VasK
VRSLPDRLLLWVSLASALIALVAGAATFFYSQGEDKARQAATDQAFQDANVASQERDRAQQRQIDRLTDNVRDLCAARARDDRETGRASDPYLCKSNGD